MEQTLQKHKAIISNFKEEFENKLKDFEFFFIHKNSHFFIAEKSKYVTKTKTKFYFFKKNITFKKNIKLPNEDNSRFLIQYIQDLNHFYLKKQQEMKILRETSEKKIHNIEKLIEENNSHISIIEIFLNNNRTYFIEIFGNKNFTIFNIDIYLEKRTFLLINSLNSFIEDNF